MTARSLLLALAAACAVAAGCGSISDEALQVSLPALEGREATASPAATPSPARKCGDPTVSLRPPARMPRPGAMPTGSYMRRIQDRGRLIAGVDQNTLRLSYLDPLTGRLEGFEIDLVRELARQLLGDPDSVDFRVVTSAQRTAAIQAHRVDIVVDAFTITCERRRDIAFSTPYLDAGQRLLVRTSSPIRGLADLKGKKVCATTTSTSIQNIRDAHVGAIPYPVAQRTDCLVALQEGSIDAVTSDDAILLGYQVQDPYTKIVGPRFSHEPYGIGIDRSHTDLVRFVNGALARMRADGTWTRLSRHWLAGLGGAHATRPPEARYAG